ncbi:zinc finger protein 438 [Thalassophryne amazonica]|uniref:zinc finger protein 438 n=1 Tax=Thalassophryne amazonica TaxID=390379 RepID=UPI001471A4DA|nr:zinc finger protein 438 [Thalassophryne amazonica]
MKSLQFRSIAPKAPAMVSSTSSAVLSCQPPPTLPETTTTSPKSIVMPTQNYALMQIAGQDGTFSLVPLPPPISSQTPQQQQQPSIQKHLKLPIPRYQPVRSKVTTDLVKSASPATKVKTPSKSSLTMQSKSVLSGTSSAKKKQIESRHLKENPVPKVEPSEQVFLIEPSSDISVTALLPENAVLYPSSRLEQTSDCSEQPGTACLIQNVQYPSVAAKSPPSKVSEEHAKTTVRLGQTKPLSSQPQSSITVLSPAIFSKAVQIIPTPPKGKLPILPYSKIKGTLIPTAKPNTVPPKKKGFSGQLGHTNPMDPQTCGSAEALSHSQGSASSIQPPMKTTVMPMLGAMQKSSGKKRGRKRKTMEDILAFEARKKRSLSFFRRRIPEKQQTIVPGSKQKEVEISKKYRSIRPKPMLLMETVPQLVSLPPVTPESHEQELVLSQLPTTIKAQHCPPQPTSLTLHLRGTSHQRVFVGSRPLHCCPTCNRCFQFKHHLQSHMNSHTNIRPYMCPVCRKAYAHSGSLSTHMKLHHYEVRPRRSLCCEFCEKAFGYVGVYFSHLREVHKVVLTVEPSISHHEDHISTERANSPETSGEQEDPVELQIKCGRCQAITPTFADMKMHLMYVHGEDIQVRLHDSHMSHGGREAENELVKHAAHYWRQLNERRNLMKCGNCDEEFFSFSKLKKHIISHHQGDGLEREEKVALCSPDGERRFGVLAAGSAFNCVLCRRVMANKEGVMEHWRSHHHCEHPSLLWDALSSYSGQEESEVDWDLDSPVPSLH